MRVVVIASQKGGAGKSTLAAHIGALADAASEMPALLIDADPQGSLTYWHERREAETPILARATAGDVTQVLADAEASGIAWVIVDTPPHNAPLLTALMKHADLVVVPVRPATFDLAASAVTFDTARVLGARAVAVINHAVAPGRHGEPSGSAQARQALERLGIEVLPGQVSQRASLQHALVSGAAVQEFEPNGAAAREIERLWRQVEDLTEKTMRMKTKKARRA